MTPSAADTGIPDLAYASLVCAATAHARIASIDVSEAVRVQGIASVLTHQNIMRLPFDHGGADEPQSAAALCSPFSTDEVRFHGQPVAMVVGNAPHFARLAASMVRVNYRRNAPLDASQGEWSAPTLDPKMPVWAPPCASQSGGTSEQGLPFTSTVVFEGQRKISVHDDAQTVQSWPHYLRDRLACGLPPQALVMLAAMAALTLERSVRIILTHQQMNDLASAHRSSVRSTSAPGEGRGMRTRHERFAAPSVRAEADHVWATDGSLAFA